MRSLTVGSKRKRATATNENAHTGGRPPRGAGRLKRQRSNTGQHTRYSSEESDSSSMEVDTPPSKWANSDDDEEKEEEEEAEEEEEFLEVDDDDEHGSGDEYLIHSAPANRLRRLRKEQLIRLFIAAGLTDDPDTLTKSALVDTIIDAREDVAELPPSSPSGKGNSSEISSDDDDHVADQHRLPSTMHRRATFNGLLTARPSAANRTRSLGQFSTLSHDSKRSSRRSSADSRNSAGSSAGSSSRNRSLASDELPTPTPSPPAPTRQRPRKPSTPGSKGKSKAKHVEFDQHPQIASLEEGGPENGDASCEESDLTELDDLELAAKTEPSPRRLRSKDKVNSKASVPDSSPTSSSAATPPVPVRRVVPKRKAKPRIGSLREDDTDEEDEEDEVDQLLDEAEEEEDLGSVEDTPRPRRVQQRPARTKRSAVTPPSDDGDDEGSNGEGEQAEEEEEEEAEDDATLVQPRVLRNGKVVGEEDDAEEMEVDEAPEEEVDDETVTEGSSTEEAEEEGSVDIEVDEEQEEEVEEAAEEEEEEQPNIDIDLTAATAKTLTRLRRDDLVRLCEDREVEPLGTKQQLAAALLQWRDNHAGDFSAPSSTGTARAPETVRKRRTRSSQDTPTTPVLERSHRVHMDEPITPPVSDDRKDNEGEVELDLESLGLDGREIPPEQLSKIEKIGSGGFKDVYVGKWKRRKVAIAEFRGQLNAMDIKELKLLSSFKHENIVKFLGVSIPENTKETPVMIVSELCSNGDLFDYIRNDKTMPSLRKMVDMMLDIAHGLNYLHTCDPSIIHRDCKSSNILITNRGTAKIADFGLAKVKESTRSLAGSLVGTVNWQAPELWVAHPQYDHKVDVYSCAMVFWEMMQWHLPDKKFPWEGMNEHAIYAVVKGKKDNRPPIDGLAKQWSSGLVDLMKWMWKQSPSDRPTMLQVIERLEQLR